MIGVSQTFPGAKVWGAGSHDYGESGQKPTKRKNGKIGPIRKLLKLSSRVSSKFEFKIFQAFNSLTATLKSKINSLILKSCYKKNSIKKQEKEQRVDLMQKSHANFYDQKTAVKHDVTCGK